MQRVLPKGSLVQRGFAAIVAGKLRKGGSGSWFPRSQNRDLGHPASGFIVSHQWRKNRALDGAPELIAHFDYLESESTQARGGSILSHTTREHV
jgi:hypothetical protein